MFFQIVGISVLAIFYGCYVFKIQDQEAREYNPSTSDRGKVGRILFIEITLKIAAFITTITQTISIVFNINKAPTELRYIGFIICIAGISLFIVSTVTMKDSWRAGISFIDKTKLVTTGIYSYSRNPSLISFYLLYIGFLFIFFNWVLFAITAFTMLMFHLQIVFVEENFLTNTFGIEYLDYKRCVNRYFGRIRNSAKILYSHNN